MEPKNTSPKHSQPQHYPQGPPQAQGLYDPSTEHDACGVGFVVNIRGEKSHQIVRSGLEILVNLTHRGACGCDPLTGDGAGILTQIPHEFFRAKAEEVGITLPAPGDYGIGVIFLPCDAKERADREQEFEKIVAEEGQSFLGWGDVPVNNSVLGPTALAVELPFVSFSSPAAKTRRPTCSSGSFMSSGVRHANTVTASDIEQKLYNYVPSLSSRTVIYKGLLLAEQVETFYHDLADERFISAPAVRASTLQHQHVPHLGSGSSVPLFGPQRRNQHASRQHQLDARPRKHVLQ